MFSFKLDINFDIQLYKLQIVNGNLYRVFIILEYTYEIYIDIIWGVKFIITQDNDKIVFIRK
ncbi:hypothetical protein TCA2_5719 [Paenibacillus sp. TCA20]|nr:hypothetical protein TCA2_5719 [Paenibacillus sp. TCA20]